MEEPTIQFRAHFDDSTLFQKIIEGVRHVVADLSFVVTPQGIQATGADDSVSNLVDINLAKDGFAEFYGSEMTRIGMNLDTFNQVLQIGFAGDHLTLQNDAGDENLKVTFQSPSEDRQSDFEVRLIDTSTMDTFEPPPLKPDFTVKMNSAVLRKLINGYQSMNPTGVTMTVSSGQLTLTVLGVELLDGKVSHTITEQEGHELRIEQHGDIAEMIQSFDLRSWVNFCRNASISNLVTIYFQAEDPCVVEYDLNDLGHMRFYVAQKESPQTQMDSQLA